MGEGDVMAISARFSHTLDGTSLMRGRENVCEKMKEKERGK